MNINWKVRFNKKNKLFIVRTVAAILLPILAYQNLEATDITSWNAFGQLLVDLVTNPYLIAITLVNVINIIPDPTTDGVGDSPIALQYKEPAKSRNIIGGK